MNPSFNLKILQSFVPIFNEKTKNMLEKLDKEVGNTNFDILPFMNVLTLDMVCGNEFFSFIHFSYINVICDKNCKLTCDKHYFTATTMGFDIDSRDGNIAFLHSIEA